MNVKNINAKKFTEEKAEYMKRYLAKIRDTKIRSEIYIFEDLLVLALKQSQYVEASEDEMIKLLKNLSCRVRSDRFLYKGYTSAESDVHDLTLMFEDMVHELLSYGDEKDDYYLEYDLCEVRDQVVLKIEVIRPDVPTSPVRYEFLQPCNSFERMARLNCLTQSGFC